MAVWTEVLNTNFSFPNINIYNKLRDGEHRSYSVYPAEGYVIYDTTAEDYEIQVDENGNPMTDPETGLPIEVPVTWYSTFVGLPLNYNFDNFPYVAVLRSEVDENYIFGDIDKPEHEVM